MEGLGLVDLDLVAGLTSLRSLDVHSNPIVDLAPPTGLTELRELRVHSTPITDLTALAGLTALEVLRADHTDVARVFAVDVIVCRKCGGRMRLLEVVDTPDAVARVLHGAAPSTARKLLLLH